MEARTGDSLKIKPGHWMVYATDNNDDVYKALKMFEERFEREPERILWGEKMEPFKIPGVRKARASTDHPLLTLGIGLR